MVRSFKLRDVVRGLSGRCCIRSTRITGVFELIGIRHGTVQNYPTDTHESADCFQKLAVADISNCESGCPR